VIELDSELFVVEIKFLDYVRMLSKIFYNQFNKQIIIGNKARFQKLIFAG